MRKSKDEIITELSEGFQALHKLVLSIPDDIFNVSKNNKWTTAENIKHLVTSTKMTSFAFTLPKFVHVALYGKPRHISHSYGKLVENYQKRLEDGAKASGVYVPKKTDYNKNKLLISLNMQARKLLNALSKKWSDEQLDKFTVMHPILGRLTIRELAYFTIYHNQHHLEIIKKYYVAEPMHVTAGT